MENKKLSLNSRTASFKFAFNGIITLFKEEPNAKIHLLCTVLVSITGLLIGLSTSEWVAIAFAVTLVIALELVNTALEKLCDIVSPEKNEQIKKIKDMAAGAVLLAATAAVLLAMYIFIPKILSACG